MNKLLRLIFVACLFFSLGCKLEDGWLGMKVFEASREDVEKRLGKPIEEDRGDVRYETDDALINIFYSGEPCSKPFESSIIVKADTLAGMFNVKKGTVLEYSIVPKKPLRIDKLDWNRERYTRTEDSHRLKAVLYWNDKDGIHFDTINFKDERGEIVQTIHFQRPADQLAKYRCQK